MVSQTICNMLTSLVDDVGLVFQSIWCLRYDNVPSEINKLRCRVNYHALKFLSDIKQMANLLASRMRNRTGSSNPYMALHLKFEKGMVGLPFFGFVGTRDEKAKMEEYRKKSGLSQFHWNNLFRP